MTQISAGPSFSSSTKRSGNRLASLAVVGVSWFVAVSLFAEEKVDLTKQDQRISYSLGADIGGNLKRQGLELDAAALAKGITDALKGTAELSEAEVQKVLQDARPLMMAQVEARQRQLAEANVKAGETFLDTNAKKAGVKTTPSGLQYKVLKEGKGKNPKSTDTVMVHYHGTLIDGSVFDSSVDRGEPMEIPVTGVIPGWVEALQMMKEGDKWELVIPPNLAYADRGAGGKIGPNTTLVFEVELLSIK